MGFLTPNAVGEKAVYQTYILHQLDQMRTTVCELTSEQAHAVPSASSLNLAALLLHTAEVALYWTAAALAAPNPPQLPDDAGEEHYLEQLTADTRSLDEVLEFFDRYVAMTQENLEQLSDLDALVPTWDAPWIPEDLTHWEARWCLQHVIAEIARHVGHADIIRESIDGKGAYELNDLAG